eukprot:TRINITY_DN9548_c0_g1_i1.p1 TRINITY_DN9548_c0_g1~~TRINITY_DN9548_c0_g1_i1.p1  ORF type:complete len:147 (-),score=34.58 TRINITY_DN9548_c0_g1_i1:411-851(-)
MCIRDRSTGAGWLRPLVSMPLCVCCDEEFVKAKLVKVFQASRQNWAHKIELVVQHCPDRVHSKDQAGFTPLHYAARHNSMQVAKLLLQAGAELCDDNKYNQSPLVWAERGGHAEMIALLNNTVHEEVNELNASEEPQADVGAVVPG